jgi:hypothetical protein
MSRLFQRFGNRQIVTPNGSATQEFDRGLQKAFERLETQIADLTQIVTDIQALQTQQAAQLAQILAAQAAADAAQADALAAARESARINSYPNPGSVLSAADVGSDCTVTIANHTRVYPVQGSIDVPDVAITGGTITGLAFSTRYYVYYDDTTLSNTTPTFLATTTSATAQVGAAAGRHFVGYIDTPADGGGSTSGIGGGTPGGGGGGSGGGYIP